MNKKQTIAFIIPSLSPGGAERMLLTVANELSVEYEVHIIFLTETGEFLSQLLPAVKRWNLNNGSVYLSIFGIRSTLRKIRPDILFPWMGFINAYIAFFKGVLPRRMRFLCRESSIPGLMNREYRLSFLFNFFYRFYNRYERVVCQSQHMAQDLQKTFRVRKEKLVVINNPIKLQPETAEIPAVRPFSLLYVGGLNEWKRVHLLIETLALLPKQYRLTIVGDGPEKYRLVELTDKKNLEQRIDFIDNVTDPTPYYRRASCLLLCSTFEGFPNVVIEALGAGCPAAGFGIVGGANEALSGYGGIIVGASDAASRAAEIRRICENMMWDRSRIAQEAREKYDLKKIIDQYKTVLRG